MRRTPDLSSKRPLLRFLVLVLVLAPVTLGLWWFAASERWFDPFIEAFTWLPRWVFGEDVIGLRPVETRWGSWEAVTNLSPQDQPVSLLTFVIPLERLSVGLPVFWALQLATPIEHRWRKLGLGTVISLFLVLLLSLLYMQSTFVTYVNEGTRLLGGTPVLALPYPDYVFYLSRLGGRHIELLLPLLLPVIVWGVLNSQMLKPGQLARESNDELPSSRKDSPT